MEYLCEVCDKTEELTEQEAYQAGWDYPPFIGVWGVVSPRTCGDCGIDGTAWWAITTGKVPTEKQLVTIKRILDEPATRAAEEQELRGQIHSLLGGLAERVKKEKEKQ